MRSSWPNFILGIYASSVFTCSERVPVNAYPKPISSRNGEYGTANDIYFCAKKLSIMSAENIYANFQLYISPAALRIAFCTMYILEGSVLMVDECPPPPPFGKKLDFGIWSVR
jgi:hypothetical protein